MSINITIRDIPEEVRDKLAGQAAGEGKSMQEYLRGELMRLAQKPTIDVWLQEVIERKAAQKTDVPVKKILRAREADRK
ncbi:MAG: hypothetical protein QF921_16055 [Pseudomonadales bacterium]|jgi:plasmid stability protein|nr:hypothetical protein [Kiritimatiellia bacterium]MDP6972998.1 hypothetical protein [Pseudomonadales bacterium]